MTSTKLTKFSLISRGSLVGGQRRAVGAYLGAQPAVGAKLRVYGIDLALGDSFGRALRLARSACGAFIGYGMRHLTLHPERARRRHAL
jgi:hypothetical protein